MNCLKKILISRCTDGIYLRWWFNGWHYFNFTNGYEIEMNTAEMDYQVLNFFSVISKIERATRITSEYSYKVTLHGITPENIAGFTGLLLAEYVEQYELGEWREVKITRGEHLIKEPGTNGYIFDFEITRKELPNSSSVYQKSLRLYIGDTLCDIDDSEIIPINKQVNNIAELQDRNTDFTASFKIRKTRAMRELFELSGEVGATTDVPYSRLLCKLVQDNVEIITGGLLILDTVDNYYYYVSIVSGNFNFFNAIAGLKLTDLSLADCNHTWTADFMAQTHLDTSPGINVVYPLCEPTDDGSAAPLTDDGDKVEMYGGWIWPFIRLQTIWEEIFTNAGYTVDGGDIIGSDLFSKLYLPIASREFTDADKFQYSVWWGGYHTMTVNEILAFSGATLIKGDETFRLGYYIVPLDAAYTFQITIIAGSFFSAPPTLYLVEGPLGVLQETFQITSSSPTVWEYEVEYNGTTGESLWIVTTPIVYYYYSIRISSIKDAKIAYGSYIEPRLYLPDMTQSDFIKMVCNLFGLVPEVTARDHKIRFWNYSELYDNMLQARDWSNYLSELDDDVEFKFGEYAQNNYLIYKQSDDVIVDNGKGNLQLNDETLPEEKDIVQLALSTCDEVRILLTNFAVDVSRIAFNKWNVDDAVYDSEDSIDPRIVYIDHCREVASPLYQKAFWIRETEAPLTGIFAAPSHEILTPKIAQSLEISFSNMIYFYTSLSRLLTKTNVRRAKFNLPAYEVAGLKHNIPIYLRQYKAYFYVNKISNYVSGRLCTVELIRL